MPRNTAKEVFERDFHAGRLVELYWGDAKPYPADKFFLVGCVKPAPILLAMNSKVNRFIESRPAMLQCQVLLRQINYSFLDWDSYLNCAEAIATFRPSVIRDQILADPKRLKAELTSASRAQVINAINISEDISELHKELIFNELKP